MANTAKSPAGRRRQQQPRSKAGSDTPPPIIAGDGNKEEAAPSPSSDRKWLLSRPDERRKALATALEQHGLSTREAANRAGLSGETALGNFFQGRSDSLNLNTLEPLSRVLNMSIDDLVGWKSGGAGRQTANQNDKDHQVPMRVVIELGNARCTIESREPNRIAELVRLIGSR